MIDRLFTRYELTFADETGPDRWSRRALLSTPVGLGAAAAMAGQARTQSGTSQREATPAAGSRDEEEHGLASMAAGIPLSAAESARSDEHMYWFAYTNLLAQWEALGLDPPASMSLDDVEVPINRVRWGMALDTGDFMNANNQDFVDDLGFQPYMAHERLLVGDSLYVFRGGLDLEALPAAWEAAGFELVTTDRGEDIWTLGPEGEEDPENLLSQAMAGHMNNVTILDSGHVVFAPQLDQVEGLLTALADGEAPLAEHQALAALAPTLPEDMMALVAMDGSMGQRAPDALSDAATNAQEERFAESDDAVGPMPLVDMILFGVTGAPFGITGGTFGDDEELDPSSAEIPEDAGHLFARFETSSSEEAAQAAEVVSYRWEHLSYSATGVSANALTEYGAVERAEVDGNVALLDFAPGVRTNDWLLSLAFDEELAVFAS